ncbi:MAG TPA: DUF1579 family protein [Candidatus Angelobacter sp.]|nr:DUF1579 family protein [Candidatus Angelobacter sp.]
MKRAFACALIAVFVLVAAAAAQTPPTPKPGPELQKLQYLVGNWRSEGDLKPSPFGPGGKFTATDHFEWMQGGFFLVNHSTGSGGGMGSVTSLAIMGYDPEEKIYTYDEFNSNGEADHSKGTINGDTWTWTSTTKMGGQTIRGRFTMTVISSTVYSYKFEMAAPGADFNLVMEGKSTKVKTAVKKK